MRSVRRYFWAALVVAVIGCGGGSSTPQIHPLAGQYSGTWTGRWYFEISSPTQRSGGTAIAHVQDGGSIVLSGSGADGVSYSGNLMANGDFQGTVEGRPCNANYRFENGKHYWDLSSNITANGQTMTIEDTFEMTRQ